MRSVAQLACTSILLLSSFLTPSLFQSHKDLQTVEDRARTVAYHIGQETVTGRGLCSGTAVGPHALLTASHCELPSDDLYVEGQPKAYTIIHRLRDGADHTIYLLDGGEFPAYATLKVKPELHLGDTIFMWGNPLNWRDFLRIGHIAGRHGDEVLYSFEVDHGDSGAAIFNDKGEVVGVLSFTAADEDSKDAGLFVGASLPLDFSQAQTDVAAGFVPDSQ